MNGRSLGAGGWVVAWLAVLACAAPDQVAPPAPSRSSESEPKPPQRIITLAPSLTETAFALGLGGRVVGVGDYDQWPPEAATRPRLGGLINPNLERMVALQPDLAVLLPSQEDIARRLETLGIETLILPSETLEDVETAYRRLGTVGGVSATAEEAVAAFRRRLAPRAVARDARVMLSLSRPVGSVATVRIAGPDTFLDELLGRLGAVNAFADAPTRYPLVGLEEILARAPDVIVEIYPEAVSAATEAALRQDWQRVAPRLPAVRDERIAVIGGTFTVVPGPRLPELYEALGVALGKNPPSVPPLEKGGSRNPESPSFLKGGVGVDFSHPSPGFTPGATQGHPEGCETKAVSGLSLSLDLRRRERGWAEGGRP